ncbi:hypothetical protein [Halorussus sp. AFM4]|uniref:hypothetical protein n=1 Tax=Halorussus sp. AFM4 TaxID=3421651 RepID=UPI003EBA8A93
MASHGTRGQSSGAARLPSQLPLALPAVSRLSWDLGSRVVAEAEVLGSWEHRRSGRTLSAYDVTDNTVVLGVRTPAGRERFYGAAEEEFEEKRPRLAAADDWRRRE